MANNGLKSFILSVDTIAVKLLLLVCCVTLIPIIVVVSFSDSLLGGQINTIKVQNEYIMKNSSKLSPIPKELNFSLQKIYSEKDNYFQILKIIAIISLFVSIIIAILVSRSFTVPLLNLVSATNKIAGGDLKHRVNIKGNDEIAKLAKTFNIMAEHLETQEQLKDNFIATLTHDLKVPMLAQKQTLDYLLNQTYGTINEEQREVLELIQSTNNSSLDMVKTLLDVYKYDFGEVNIVKNKFNMVELIDLAIKEINSIAEEKNISIKFNYEQPEFIVFADNQEIKRVIHNLISNAINSGISGGNIDVAIKTSIEQIYYPAKEPNIYTTLNEPIDISNSVLISVKDNGTGIDEEDIPKLFKKFSPGKGRKPSGSGLGLYYSYQVISRHKGFIWVECKGKESTEFVFTIPAEGS